jgi:hypothetical protein
MLCIHWCGQACTYRSSKSHIWFLWQILKEHYLLGSWHSYAINVIDYAFLYGLCLCDMAARWGDEGVRNWISCTCEWEAGQMSLEILRGWNYTWRLCIICLCKAFCTICRHMHMYTNISSACADGRKHFTPKAVIVWILHGTIHRQFQFIVIKQIDTYRTVNKSPSWYTVHQEHMYRHTHKTVVKVCSWNYM